MLLSRLDAIRALITLVQDSRAGTEWDAAQKVEDNLRFIEKGIADLRSNAKTSEKDVVDFLETLPDSARALCRNAVLLFLPEIRMADWLVENPQG